jgi:hypothetical protein
MLTCSVKFKTHAASITVHDDGHITCFKHTHNNQLCAYESFTSKELAGEFMIEPFPTSQYIVELHE